MLINFSYRTSAKTVSPLQRVPPPRALHSLLFRGFEKNRNAPEKYSKRLPTAE